MPLDKLQTQRWREWSAAVLTALALTLLMQLVRVYFPVAFDFAEDLGGASGFIIGAAIGLDVFATRRWPRWEGPRPEVG